MSPWFPTLGTDPSWGIVASSGLAVSGLCLRRITRNVLPCLIVLASGFWALESIIVSACHPDTGPIQRIAWSCAAMAVWWSVVGACDHRLRRRQSEHGACGSRLAVLARAAALLLGVTAGIIILTVLSMQGIYALIDLVHGHPALRYRDFGFDERGLWSIGFLTLATTVALWSTRDRRLPACLLLALTVLVSWTILLEPMYRLRPMGGYERTPALLHLGLTLSGILAGTAMFARRLVHSTASPADDAGDAVSGYPGIAAGTTALSVVCLAIVAYHLLVPIRLNPGGARLACGLLTITGALATFGSAIMLRLRWSPYLADATLTLAALTLCTAMTAFIPENPTALADRFPMIFNAIMLGLVLAAGACAFTAQRLTERGIAEPKSLSNQHIISWLKRFAFFNAAMALVAGGMMGVWPSLPGIAAMDDSLGRVAAGAAAHLALVVVAIYCAQRVRRGSFYALALLAIIATGAFVVGRVLPFASHAG